MHPVVPATIKWIRRVCAGCLATLARLFGYAKRVDSPKRLCSRAAEEDEEHAVAGCPATGTSEWLMLLRYCKKLATKGCFFMQSFLGSKNGGVSYDFVVCFKILISSIFIFTLFECVFHILDAIASRIQF